MPPLYLVDGYNFLHAVVLKGRVAHCSISDVEQEVVHYRSGVEFIDPPERIRGVIVEFIGAIKAGRRLV